MKLMMAGDVESNPGPPCAACNRAIRINTVPLQCGGCGGAVHASCSGLTRREVARGCPFECPRCRGEHRQTEEVEEERRPCVACGELLRRGATYAGCECGQRAHKKCTGLPRGSTGEWSCPRCVTAGEGQQEEEEELEVGEQEPLGKCPKCRGRLRRVKTPLKCSRCSETYHLKCVEGQRLAVELARDAGTWICGECREENVAAEQEGNHPDTEVTSGARQSRGLKIIQWNCDWMATKVDELAGLMREEKPDVVVLQETKLREGDPTPYIEGYVVTKFDRRTRRKKSWKQQGKPPPKKYEEREKRSG